MERVESITAYKCNKCGAVLKTKKGVKHHLEHCKFIPCILDGQLDIDDFIIQQRGEYM